MNVTTTPVGLLTAVLSICFPLVLQGQQVTPASAGAYYGGPSYTSTDHMDAPCHSIPYAYLWDGYCDESARRYECRMHHAMNAAAMARCTSGACPAEKYHLMKESINARLNVFAPCGNCDHCRASKPVGCGQCKGIHFQQPGTLEPAQTSLPVYSDSAHSGVQPMQEPVFLTPVEQQPQDNDEPLVTTRSPVVRLAPEAPQPPGSRPAESTPARDGMQRVPRNVIPPRPADPRSAALPVRTNLSSRRFTQP